MIVLDASVLIEILLRTKEGQKLESLLLKSSREIAAPELLDIEVCQVIRRYFLLKELTEDRGQKAIDDLSAFPIQRYPHEALVGRIWKLKDNLTAYDAAYVALAEKLKAKLVTRDKKLGAASKKWIRVEVL